MFILSQNMVKGAQILLFSIWFNIDPLSYYIFKIFDRYILHKLPRCLYNLDRYMIGVWHQDYVYRILPFDFIAEVFDWVIMKIMGNTTFIYKFCTFAVTLFWNLCQHNSIAMRVAPTFSSYIIAYWRLLFVPLSFAHDWAQVLAQDVKVSYQPKQRGLDE